MSQRQEEADRRRNAETQAWQAEVQARTAAREVSNACTIDINTAVVLAPTINTAVTIQNERGAFVQFGRKSTYFID